ncbi:MAG: hypothetical protein J6I96_06485 [Oscillospiraceae bacterium]|nr:hypothetical protein [Oscillospiraceae bacterium]
MGTVIIEGLVACFLLLIPCVVGIANSPVNMVFFYEKEVKERVIANGLTTQEKIDRGLKLFRLYSIIPLIVFPLVAVYGINGTVGFTDGFIQICTILLMMGLFDRIFIDWYWVGKTKAWIIEGTQDLQPYIYGKTLIGKWLFTLIGFPVLAAVLSLIMSFILV